MRHVEAERRLLAAAQAAAALRIVEGPAREAIQSRGAALAEMTAATEAALAESQARPRALEDSTWRAVAMALLISLAVALGASALLAYRMTRSLGRLAMATASLAAGAWNGPMAAEGRDEIGDLGRSLNRMAARPQEVDRLISRLIASYPGTAGSPTLVPGAPCLPTCSREDEATRLKTQIQRLRRTDLDLERRH